MFGLLKKYKNHTAKSNIHKSEYLTQWYHSHLLGEYPVKKFDANELPKVIADHFLINKDYLYFRNRIDERKHVAAREKAGRVGNDLAGSVLASDAFFPFPDGLEVAVEAGATAVIQPGGSTRDEEVIAAADRLGIAMLMTGVRHFRH